MAWTDHWCTSLGIAFQDVLAAPFLAPVHHRLVSEQSAFSAPELRLAGWPAVGIQLILVGRGLSKAAGEVVEKLWIVMRLRQLCKDRYKVNPETTPSTQMTPIRTQIYPEARLGDSITREKG